jgi:hypothetical protein
MGADIPGNTLFSFFCRGAAGSGETRRIKALTAANPFCYKYSDPIPRYLINFWSD